MQDFDDDYLNWMELGNLEMQLIDSQTNTIWTNRLILDIRERIEELERRRIYSRKLFSR